MELKNRFFLLMLLSATLFVGFTSCNDDDDFVDEEEIDYAAGIEGTYKGVLNMSGISIVQDVEIIVTRNSNSRVTVSMDQDLTSILGYQFNVDCISDVSFEDGIYTTTGNTTWLLLNTVEMNGTFNSTSANIIIWVSIPLVSDFEFVFIGDKE